MANSQSAIERADYGSRDEGSYSFLAALSSIKTTGERKISVQAVVAAAVDPVKTRID